MTNVHFFRHFSATRYGAVLAFFCMMIAAHSMRAIKANAQPAESKVYVPSMNLIFKSLDSVAKNKVNWKNLALYSQTTTYSGRHVISLNLGVRASDAFVAAQAKDDNTFLQMAVASAGLSSKLGVEMDQTMNQKMIELVKQGKWEDVRKTLDEQQKTMRQRINRLDKDAATLVVVGGWLEGLQVISKALIANYSEGGSSLIRNPKVLEYLVNEMNTMSPSAKSNPVVKKVMAQLPEVQKLVNIEKPAPIPLDNIKKVSTITSGLVKDIEGAKD